MTLLMGLFVRLYHSAQCLPSTTVSLKYIISANPVGQIERFLAQHFDGCGLLTLYSAVHCKPYFTLFPEENERDFTDARFCKSSILTET